MDIQLTEAEKIKVLNSNDMYGIMQKILLREQKIDQNREHFWVIGLENNNRILFIELISLGTVNATLVEPMEVYSLALQKRAVKIMLCHNHPSGELKPSEADKDVTDRLLQVGIIIKLPVIDHLIISTTSYISFDTIGLLDTLKESTKYVPTFELIHRIKKEADKLVKEATKKARNARNIEIARELKRREMPVETIVEITGLTVEEVDKLKIRKKK
jgi:DNA repair protein RadC